MNRIQVLVLILSLLLLVSMISELDARDQERHEEFYCAMVAEGSWPAYNKEVDCGE